MHSMARRELKFNSHEIHRTPHAEVIDSRARTKQNSQFANNFTQRARWREREKRFNSNSDVKQFLHTVDESSSSSLCQEAKSKSQTVNDKPRLNDTTRMGKLSLVDN
jgi:hypothetical protein